MFSAMLQPYILLKTQSLALKSSAVTVADSKPYSLMFYELYAMPQAQPLTFIPAPCTDIIITYDNSGNGYIYNVPSTGKVTALTPDLHTHIIGVRFDDELKITEKRSDTAALISRLAASDSFKERTNIINKFITDTNLLSACPAKVSKLRSCIKETSGSITINELSEITGYSNRHINRMFTEYFGYGPKDYCRLIRFQLALSEIIDEPQRCNSEFISHIGYSDQAHFQREFKQFMNETPRQFIKKLTKAEIPPLQYC